jgi:hypothetical protein
MSNGIQTQLGVEEENGKLVALLIGKHMHTRAIKSLSPRIDISQTRVRLRRQAVYITSNPQGGFPIDESTQPHQVYLATIEIGKQSGGGLAQLKRGEHVSNCVLHGKDGGARITGR